MSVKNGPVARRLGESVAAALRAAQVRSGELILLGLSGGRDSVALLYLLLELSGTMGVRVAAAHLNHRLRGAESDRDEDFVRELCARHEVALVVGRPGVYELAGSNLEERARDLRHSFLNETARRIAASHIALAHHADDQAETVLMRMLRGTGVTGLSAMAVAGPGCLIRPLLGISREQVNGYLEEVGAAFVTDSSNTSPHHLRNRIRGELIPKIEREYAPGARRRLAALAGEMAELDDFVRTLAKTELERRSAIAGEVDLAGFSQIHPVIQSALLRSLIESRVGSLRKVERVHIVALLRLCLEGPPNGKCALPGGLVAKREYAKLKLAMNVSNRCDGEYSTRLAPGTSTALIEARFEFDCVLGPRDTLVWPQSHLRAVFDAEGARADLTVRNFRSGDRIAPLGLGGSRKVKKILIEAQMPRIRRQSFPIVEVGGKIAWLPGLKRGAVGLITPQTRWIVSVEARPLKLTPIQG